MKYSSDKAVWGKRRREKKKAAPVLRFRGVEHVVSGFLSVTPSAEEQACVFSTAAAFLCCGMQARRECDADERVATNAPGIFGVHLLIRPACAHACVRVILLLHAAAALQSTSCILTQSLRHK